MGLDLYYVTSLALVDSINPCTLAVQALLLASLLATRGRKSVLIGGLIFTATIYLMYTLYGLGILQVLYMLGYDQIIKYVLEGLLLILAGLEFIAYFRYKPGMASIEMPMKLRPITQKVLSSVDNPLVALPAAVLCSILLLPCSSGPYVIMLGLIKSLPFALGLIWILYYNVWFVLPMILITLLVYFGTKPEKIMEWREKHVRELHLVAGLLLILVFLMVVGIIA